MNHQRTIRFRVDWYTRACLSALAVLMTVLILGLWAQGVPSPSPAGAAESFGDSASQRQSMIDEQKATNEKLDELISLLKSGDVTVQISGATGEEPATKDGAGK